MAVGKNSIKRAVNNGYSKVETSAPDMENSEVVEVAEVKTEKKASAKKAPAKCAKTPAKKQTVKKSPATKTEKDGFVRVEVGDSMPFYLL